MRDQYHRNLDALAGDLAALAGAAAAALHQAHTALLDADLSAAQDVIGGDKDIDTARAELDERTLDLIARQQPVARDLRTLVASLRISTDLERMGDLAAHIAQVARRRHPYTAIPPELTPMVDQMGTPPSKWPTAWPTGSRPETPAVPALCSRWKKPSTNYTAACTSPSWRRKATGRSRPQSTSPSSAGTTSATPTTPCPSPPA